ncbi:hypothetical protein HPB48_019282 [Haemaphysalis longicornis]|uniref:Uncharacterized protein n=1 Tax=Haemaphysalis longicornis TaxID=44386 RepID=A0A9J6FCA4_HAELO|nr:hypothetical protein HPB48_019282 [Haemaphysalis longicornis]
MRRYHATRQNNAFKCAHSKFKFDFVDRHYGVSCEVCDCVLFDNNVSKIGNVKDSDGKEAALGLLVENFPQRASNVKEFVVCGMCKESLVNGVMPNTRPSSATYTRGARLISLA